MVSGRPLLYLSLPGVAFILGVFWFRRRNRNRAANDDPKGKDKLLPAEATAAEPVLSKATHVQSQSMQIHGKAGDGPDDDNPATKLFGKSAPIQIVQNGRSASPIAAPPQPVQPVDSEVLKSKIQNADHKILRSIDESFENLSSPVDLPDSLHKRQGFYARNVSCQQDEPVVIRATRTPKISPENSFLESKYQTKECEQNNNCENKASTPPAASADTNGNTNNNNSKPLDTSSPKSTPAEAGAATQVDEAQPQTELSSESDSSSGNEKRTVEAASPSLSLCSVQSADSGKGSSLPRSEANNSKITTYEFFFPNSLVGQLYGRRRNYIKYIKHRTNANIRLDQKMLPGKLRVCVIEGTESEIEATLAILRQRLPLKRYPNFTMERIYYSIPQTVIPLSTENLVNLKLSLIEGINNDVSVSAVISGCHLFVQHPLHPTHRSLAIFQTYLQESYSSSEAPLLPSLEVSAVCVMPASGVWYRVQIVSKDEEDDQRCVVQFLDFGGYMDAHFNDLRQIRSDFMGMPFQATECVLSNIEPIDATWTPEAVDILCKLTSGIVLQAQVAGYNSQNIPEIFLFACLGPNNVIFINKELVARNLARWVD